MEMTKKEVQEILVDNKVVSVEFGAYENEKCCETLNSTLQNGVVIEVNAGTDRGEPFIYFQKQSQQIIY